MNFYTPVIFKRVIIFTILFLFFFPLLSSSQSPYPATDDEFVGPFPSWINVKTQYGAIGDGVADETAALQTAFNAVGNANSTATVVYIPAGTYRITGTLTMNFKMNVSIIGEDPATTKIIWAGASGGIMLQINGTAYSRFNRIKWDGNFLASICIDQSYSQIGGYFDTGNEYRDDMFFNSGIGIRGGAAGAGFAETAIMSCTFHKNTVAGITVGNFNAIDCWVWHSVFDSCAVGITNANPTSAAGNFRVYNSVFRSSTTSDIVINNTNGEFSFRDNTSTNSQTFIKASLKPYPANITIQANKILDPISNTAIDIRNQGPILLLDNVFRSRASSTGPVVNINPSFTYYTCDLISMGNTFTVSNSISSNNGKKIIYDNPIVSAASLSALSEQALPGTQPNLNRLVFEIPAGATTSVIQSMINQAATFTGYRPVVHFPYGTYNITSTLTVPTGSDMQIVGDGDGDMNPTWLVWQGSTAGPVIKILGPSKVALRDFSINGNNTAANILMTNVDQSSSRVFMHEAEFNITKSNLLVNGLDNTTVLVYNSRFSASAIKSVNVVGGSLASGGNPQQGKTIIYAADGYDNNLNYEVTKGGNLLVRDQWYETTANNSFLNLPELGIATVEGSRIYYSHNSGIPGVSLADFSGKACLLNTMISDTLSISGNGSQTNFLGLGVQFGNNTLKTQPPALSYINNTSTGTGDIRSLNCRANDSAHAFDPATSGSYAVNNIGVADSSFIASMIQSARSTHAQVLTSLPFGISDVRLYRIWNYNSLQSIEIQGSLNGALALNFVYLNAQCKNGSNTITWHTASEINSEKFNVEKSLDGNSWDVIGSVAGAGSNSAEKTYSYIDKENSGGFYRIVAYDIYGKKTYSPVIKSSCNDLINSFSVVPNPVSDVAIVSIVSDKSSPLELSLFDGKGALVKKIATKILPGSNKIEMNMKELINGIYILRTSWAGNVKATRLKKINK